MFPTIAAVSLAYTKESISAAVNKKLITRVRACMQILNAERTHDKNYKSGERTERAGMGGEGCLSKSASLHKDGLLSLAALLFELQFCIASFPF